jgi:hypothetical protein
VVRGSTAHLPRAVEGNRGSVFLVKKKKRLLILVQALLPTATLKKKLLQAAIPTCNQLLSPRDSIGTGSTVYMGHPGQQNAKHQHAAQKILLNTPKMFDSYSKGTFEYEYSRNSPKKSNFEYRIRIEYYHYYRRWCTIQEVYRCGATTSSVPSAHTAVEVLFTFYGFCSPRCCFGCVSAYLLSTVHLVCIAFQFLYPENFLACTPSLTLVCVNNNNFNDNRIREQFLSSCWNI